MKVLFDGYWWTGGPPSGRMLARELVEAWLSCFPHDEVHVGVRADDVDAVGQDIPQACLHPLRMAPHAASVIFELGVVARRIGVDVAIAHNFTPITGRVAVFIQDVLFQTNPEWFGRAERMYLAAIPIAARRAELVLASSVSEANRIRMHNPRLRRVVPVGLGVSTALMAATPVSPLSRLAQGEFVLSVGRLNVRKNLGVALEAATLARSVTPGRPLVVVGEKQGLDAALPRAVQTAVAAGEVVFLGSVPDAALRWLYENARALVYVSRDEGFGLPPVEALTFGCPVIVSDIPVFRETMDGSAVFVTPDERSVARAFDELDVSAAGSVSGYSTGRGAAYRWPKVAAAIRDQVFEGSA